MTEKEYAQLRYLLLLKEVEDIEIELEKKRQQLKVALKRLEKIDSESSCENNIKENDNEEQQISIRS